ncbi:DUF3455 domain-containing protein [Phormidium tenue FACHB-886]|nr:DUF3455 domain-containing protein [Phormidium tenue FACHB-886]
MQTKTVLGIVLSLLAAGSISVKPLQAQTTASIPVISEELQPPDSQLLSVVNARGEQIYQCQSSSWVLLRPEATLFDARNQEIGQHGEGPSWSFGADEIRGTRVALQPAVNSEDIPWLILKASSDSRYGGFAVNYIQRFNTVGGQPPSDGKCDQEGREIRVNYSASYAFWTPLQNAR